MKIALISLLFLLQNTWVDHTDLNGRFKISTPGALEEKIDTISTEVGLLVYHTFFYQNSSAKADTDVFMISYCDYPDDVVLSDSTDFALDFLQNTMESAAESVNGEVMYATDIQLENYPGKFWRIDYMDGNAVIKTKAYLVKNRYYAVQFISFNEKKLVSPADQFFDSFSIF